MESEQFKNIGSVKVDVYKSSNDKYLFYLESSNTNVLHIAYIIDDTLKLY